MTSTPRLDSLTAGGTHDLFDHIRLADGHVLTLKTQPGADTADQVFLMSGLTAPDTEAWENEDRWAEWLTGGDPDDGALFLEVPVEAVRDLIIEHGGEHEDQEGEQPTPGARSEAGEETAPDPLTQLADLHGRFKDGYSADDIRTIFGRIFDAGGPYLVCVWDYADAHGFGGASQFYAEDEDGDLFEVQPDIHRWLSGQQETPGPVDTWVCAPADEPAEYAVGDDFHNYARADGWTTERFITGWGERGGNSAPPSAEFEAVLVKPGADLRPDGAAAHGGGRCARACENGDATQNTLF
ncbi:hypothetical protein AB0K09_03670 [Streptomyces sp. NPDC049577]|uniref:hypothetical protein n=1 Tax=Streptomyces sp. NPDC049577 TaxID=3155153 RepID=UPI00342ED415